uniref:Uncharacterized protein n=1 Tax=Arundo donax TaxID=35708 RepID=A0A0A9Q1A8_ARUDO
MICLMHRVWLAHLHRKPPFMFFYTMFPKAYLPYINSYFIF